MSENLPEEYLYKLAELENSYKRKEQLLKADSQKEIENFLSDLFVISDDLERAILDDSKFSVKDYKDFCGLVWKKLQHSFTKVGVTLLGNTEDGTFDDSYQEAVSLQEGEEPGKVITLTQHGYSRNSKLLRTAKVVVSK